MSGDSQIFLVKISAPGGAATGSRAHLVDKPQFSIGRSQEADLPLPSPSISRIHVKIEIQNGQVVALDQGSANGSYIDGEKMNAHQPYPLLSTTRLKMGTAEEEIAVEFIPKPMELMNPDAQKKVLMTSLSEIFRLQETQFKVDQEREITRIRETGQRELDQVKVRAQAQAQRFLDQANVDAEKLVMEGRREAEKIQNQVMAEVGEKRKEIDNARFEAERIVMEARREADKLNAQAQSEALTRRKELESAKLEAERIVMEGRRESERVQSQALSGVLDKKRQIEQETIELEHRAQTQMAQAKLAAQKEADQLIAAAQKQIKQDYAEAAAKNDLSFKETIDRSKEIIRQADQKSSEIIQQAKASSVQLRLQLDEEIKSLRTSAQAQAKAIVDDSQKRAQAQMDSVQEQVQVEINRLTEEHRHEIARQRDALQREIEENRIKLLSQTKKEVQLEQEKIIEEYSTSVDHLRKDQIELGSQVQALKAEHARLTEQKTYLTKDVESLQSQQRDDQQSMHAIRDQLQKAKELVAKSDSAQARADEAEAKRERAQHEFETYQRKYAEGVAKIEGELKEKREKALIDFEQTRKSQEEDLAKSKLKRLEDVKKQIEREEKKYFETLELRTVEVTKSLELKLIPKMEELLRSGRGVDGLSDMIPAIQKAVEEGILKGRSSIQAVTEHLGVDPQAEIEQKKKIKKYVSWAAAASVLLVIVFHRELRDYANRVHNLAMSEAKDKRDAQSIYSPPQTDEWRLSYTENVLYMRGYLDTKTDSLYNDQWTLRLNDVDFVRSMGLNEEDMVRFISREMNMVLRLGSLRDAIDATKLDQGLDQMKNAEAEDIRTLKEIVKGDDNFNRIRDLEKDFTLRFIKKRGGPRPASVTETAYDSKADVK